MQSTEWTEPGQGTEAAILTAERRGLHVDTEGGTLCTTCAPGTEYKVVGLVDATYGCYNCNDTPGMRGNCWCHASADDLKRIAEAK